MRGASILWHQRAHSVARELASGGLTPEPGRERLVETRTDVTRGWNAMAELLETQGHRELASCRQEIHRSDAAAADGAAVDRPRAARARVVRARELERGYGR